MLVTLLRPLAILGFSLAFGAAAANAAQSHASFNAFGTRMTVEVSVADTHGASSSIRMEIPPGGGPPAAHIHTREDETYVVTRGTFRFWHGKHVVDAPQGTVVFLPRNEAHQFLNVGSTQGELILTIVPGTLQDFFQEVGKRRLVMPKDHVEVIRLSSAYGIRYVPSLAQPPQK